MHPLLDTVLTCSTHALSPSSRVKRRAITAIERALRHPMPESLRTRCETSVKDLTEGLRFANSPHEPSSAQATAQRWVAKAEAVASMDALLAFSIPRVVKAQVRQARLHLANSLQFSGGKPGDKAAREALAKITGLSEVAQLLRKQKLKELDSQDPHPEKRAGI